MHHEDNETAFEVVRVIERIFIVRTIDERISCLTIRHDLTELGHLFFGEITPTKLLLGSFSEVVNVVAVELAIAFRQDIADHPLADITFKEGNSIFLLLFHVGNELLNQFWGDHSRFKSGHVRYSIIYTLTIQYFY
ncbi:hypothetical protein D3C87_1558860 [compost metagenome]